MEEELEAMRELRRKLQIWGGTGGIKRAIEDYEAYMKLDLRDLQRVLERIADSEKDVKKALRLLVKGE